MHSEGRCQAYMSTKSVKYSATHHPMEKVVTRHGGGALGEKRRGQVGPPLVQNLLGMNESCDSRSNIRTVLSRSTPGRRKNRPRLRNRCTLLLPAGHTASPCL